MLMNAPPCLGSGALVNDMVSSSLSPASLSRVTDSAFLTAAVFSDSLLCCETAELHPLKRSNAERETRMLFFMMIHPADHNHNNDCLPLLSGRFEAFILINDMCAKKAEKHERFPLINFILAYHEAESFSLKNISLFVS